MWSYDLPNHIVTSREANNHDQISNETSPRLVAIPCKQIEKEGEEILSKLAASCVDELDNRVKGGLGVN